MHIGNFLNSELKRQRISIAEVAKAVNKSDTGVRKDLEKDSLHQSVIEAYAKVLDINIYQVLAADFEGKEYTDQPVKSIPEFREENEEGNNTNPAKNIEVLSVNISVPADKQEALLKLLMS